MAAEVPLPIPISFVSGRYLIFSADAATYLRREYNICGVLMGTLPHVPQQNVFLGIPLELMPEEARLLVEKKVARIIDTRRYHNESMRSLAEADKIKYLQTLQREGRSVSLAMSNRKEQQREESLRKAAQKRKAKASSTQKEEEEAAKNTDDMLFEPPPRPASSLSSSSSSVQSSTISITPATTCPLLPYQPAEEYDMPLPEVPASYPVFAHLHSHGYFLSPGLRFGCQYMAYPGDPLRFHSHFLVYGFHRDQELNLMEIVSGGRLGTGVKKGFLLGHAVDPGDPSSEVRTFSIEWAGIRELEACSLLPDNALCAWTTGLQCSTSSFAIASPKHCLYTLSEAVYAQP
ncbi:tRNA-splicing endonuclease subunit sen34 [Talaromyces stipitatus ATCC 10500]|uniref:tRNA-splicing endonuclease subunit Sen34 n=1 Tax=Talaromyces stipitatus (strain ATCC 10500 / CBS 375.48 / QM 6759 / NRRL 1006) TaxID=441959 RepID=B8LSY3_TALSN|nr:tRNA-splicing endonuclease subunit sen34 [Talaromyces stipitatus ATCC 10500]EED22979.1 tRNA-splicing endonuclease subunit sen34 [Talaromyces stipitatus ATCC 10500]